MLDMLKKIDQLSSQFSYLMAKVTEMLPRAPDAT
jgi:hypothetical protein